MCKMWGPANSHPNQEQPMLRQLMKRGEPQELKEQKMEPKELRVKR